MKDRSGRQRHRWRRALLGAVAALLVVLASYPFWLPLLIKPLAKRAGIQIGAAKCLGYSRLQLSNLAWTNRTTRIVAEKLVVDLPHRWLLNRAGWSATWRKNPQIDLAGWRVELLPSPEPSSPGTGSTASVLADTQTIGPRATAWLRHVRASGGTLVFSGRKFTVDEITLNNDSLDLTGEGVELRADLGDLAQGRATLEATHDVASAEIHLAHDDRWRVNGEIGWMTNRFSLRGWFGPDDWWPAEAEIRNDALTVPPALLGLSPNGSIGGSLRLDWTNGTYALAASLNGQQLLSGEWMTAPVGVSLHGSGDLESVRLDRLSIDSPQISAKLEAPLTVRLADPRTPGEASLRLAADLNTVPALAMRGRASVELTLRPCKLASPAARFTIQGTRLEGFGVKGAELAATGTLAWPNLDLGVFQVRLEAGGVLSASGTADLRAHSLTSLEWALHGPPPNDLLPEASSVKGLKAGGTLHGPWTNLTHSGEIQLDQPRFGRVHADAATLSWSGSRLDVEDLRLALASGGSEFGLAGKARFQNEGTETAVDVDLLALSLTNNHGTDWRLTQPAQLALSTRPDGWAASVSEIHCEGGGGTLKVQAELDWPETGRGSVELSGVPLRDLSDFLDASVPDVLVHAAAVHFDWDASSPLLGTATTRTDWRMDDGSVWEIGGRMEAGPANLALHELAVQRDGASVGRVRGQFPITVRPDGTHGLIQVDPTGTVELDLLSTARGPFWRWIESVSGVRIEGGHVELTARGNPTDVTGNLTLHADRLTSTTTNLPRGLPAVENLDIQGKVGLGAVTINQGTFAILDQPVKLSARWPVSASDWSDWIHKIKKPDLGAMSGRVEVHDASLPALAAVLPPVLQPMGALGLDAQLKPGLQVEGALTLTHAATAYLPPMGALREIEAEIRLRGRQAEIQRFQAELAGQPVTLSGTAAWSEEAGLLYDLRLRGTNLSLVHEPDLFVRADLDLKVTSRTNAPTRISGDVTLQNSYLFRDIQSLMQINLNQPEQRPPFFSVQTEPLANWQLDVRAQGERFLKVITPVFKGDLSAGLRFSGTLAEPVAVGNITVDKGRIIFPFGSLDVDRGRLSLRRDDPYRPRLDFRGQRLNFGYDLSVEISGPVDAPNILFSSIPPLSARQILLMLSAGEIPRTDFQYSTFDKASRVGLFVGKQFLSQLFANPDGAERLTFQSGEYITDDGRPTYSIEYKMTDRWSAFGEYNRFNDFNGGVKYKVLSR